MKNSQQTDTRTRAPRREIFGWAMFDFANQAYTLLIITVIFPVLFTTVIVGGEEGDYRLGNLLWSLGLATSYLMVVFTGPVIGAIMDFSASKKRFLFYSWVATILPAASLWFVEPGMIMLAMTFLILSNFAYSSGENIIASFLPHLGPPGELGRISGFGWAMGYLGGLVAAGFVILFLGDASAENYERARWVGPFAAAFFLLSALPTFAWLQEPGNPRRLPASMSYTSMGFYRLGRTLSELGRYRDLALFMLSIFFSMAAIYIVVAFAFIYGDQVVGWDENVRILMFIIVQITAAAGAWLFGHIQDRRGAMATYIATLALWFFGVLGIWGVEGLTQRANGWLGLSMEVQHMFLLIGVITGVSLGSSQSAGRTLVGLFTPEEKAAEFFGFWGLFTKLAGVFGIIGLGLLQTQFGLKSSVLFCALLFLLAILVCLFVDQKRGEQAAHFPQIKDDF